MNWGKVLLTIAKGVARAFSSGLLGRGRKTEKAGEIAGGVLEDLERKEKTE